MADTLPPPPGDQASWEQLVAARDAAIARAERAEADLLSRQIPPHGPRRFASRAEMVVAIDAVAMGIVAQHGAAVALGAARQIFSAVAVLCRHALPAQAETLQAAVDRIDAAAVEITRALLQREAVGRG